MKITSLFSILFLLYTLLYLDNNVQSFIHKSKIHQNRNQYINDIQHQSRLIKSNSNSRLIPLKFSGDISVDLYDAQLFLSSFIETQLSAASPTSIAFLYGAGLLTAFSPCAISLLPLTMAYLGSSSTASPSPSMTSSTQSTPIIDTTTNGSKMIDKISNTDMVTLNKKDESGNKRLLIKSSLYAAGLATTLTLFGLSAALLGNVFGSSGVIG